MSEASSNSRGRGRPRVDAHPALPREEALRTALQIFAREGFEAASVREIARQLGVSHALVRHHFGSKQQLWEACVDLSFGAMNRELIERMQSVGAADDLAGALRSLIVEYIKLSSRFPENLLLLTREGSAGGERMEYILDHHFRSFVAAGRAVVEARQEQGILRDVPWESLFMLVATGGPAVHAMAPLVGSLDEAAGSRILDPASVERYASTVADIVLFGVVLQTESR